MSIRLLLVCVGLSAACSSGGGDSTSGGDDVQEGSGDFSSVWQASSANLYVVDTANPLAGTQQDYALPKTVTEPNAGLELESYVAFDASHVIRYAHDEGQSVYYSVRETATVLEESYITDSTQLYLDDGALTEIAVGILEHTDGSAGATNVYITLTYAPVSFPPSDWPSDVIAYEESSDL